MSTFQLNPTASWVSLEEALAPAAAQARAGRGDDARDIALGVLADHGIPATRSPLATDATLAWLVVYGRDADREVMVAALPPAELTPADLAVIADRWSIGLAFGETCLDAPEQWALWARVATGLGARSVGDFATDLAARAAAGQPQPDESALAALAGRWAAHLALRSSGGGDPTQLDQQLAGIVMLREFM